MAGKATYIFILSDVEVPILSYVSPQPLKKTVTLR